MMSTRHAPLAAHSFALIGLGVTLAGAVGAVVWRMADPVPIVPNNFGFGDLSLVSFGVFGIAFAAVGSILVVRRSSNAVGWVMVVIGLCYALAALTAAITFSAVADGPSAAGTAAIAGWWAVVFSTTGGLVFALGLIFPTGRGQTPAWDRFVRALAVLMSALIVVGFIIRPGPLQVFPSIDNPFGFGPDLRQFFGPQPSAAIAGSIVWIVPVVAWSMVSRYRMSEGVERQQLKWFVASLLVAIGGIAFAALASFFTDRPPEAGLALFGFAGALVPVAIGVAILRHGLYDIDRIISRSISYGALTVVLAAIFTVVILVVGGTVTAVTSELLPSVQGETIAVAVSTLVVFTLFQPVRTRLQRAVDRRFDRARYDGERTIAAFAGRLRSNLDLASITADVTRTADATMHPTSSSVWLRGKAKRASRSV